MSTLGSRKFRSYWTNSPTSRHYPLTIYQCQRAPSILINLVPTVLLGYTGSCLWSTVAKTYHSMWIFNIQIEYWNWIHSFYRFHSNVHSHGIKIKRGKNQNFLHVTSNLYTGQWGVDFTYLRDLLLFYVQLTSVKKAETYSPKCLIFGLLYILHCSCYRYHENILYLYALFFVLWWCLHKASR